jgi:hypothetical protein
LSFGIGIVGCEGAKFTPASEARARELIRGYLLAYDYVASGACHLGGIDVWAIEEAVAAGVPYTEYPPRVRGWEDGYKPRNMQIAADPRVRHVICITLREYPPSYTKDRYPSCYHCGTKSHVKSGGCWTVKFARQKLKKTGEILVI